MNKMIKGAFVGAAVVLSCFFAACSDTGTSGDDVSKMSQEENTSHVLMSKTDLDLINSYWNDFCDEDDESCDEEEETYPKKAISLNKTKDKFDKSVDVVEICYTKLESPDAEEVTVCPVNLDGSDLPVKFFLAAGTTFADSGYVLEYGKVHFGGIDLTDGLVIRKKKILTPVGRYTLFVVVDGSLKKVASFRRAGDLEVIPGDAVAYYYDENDRVVENLTASYKFVGAGVATNNLSLAMFVPVYISAITGEEDGKYILQPQDAVGMSYTLIASPEVKLFTVIAGEAIALSLSDVRTIGNSGIDTLYAMVYPSDMEQDEITVHLKVSGSSGVPAAEIVFKKP